MLRKTDSLISRLKRKEEGQNYLINVVLLILLGFIVVVIVQWSKTDSDCKTKVSLRGGSIIQCKWVNSYASGFSSIHTCNDSVITIETKYIENVSSIE